MKTGERYYMLVSSLPHLQRSDRLDRLPINRERLENRLGMLEAEDAEILRLARTLLDWRAQEKELTDGEIQDRYETLMELNLSPGIRSAIEHRMDMRTILAGLRRRRLGHGPPQDWKIWGVGNRRWHVVRNWDQPDFGLGFVFPWITQARSLLEARNAVGLERHLMSVTWGILDWLTVGKGFGFEAVFSYYFKWEILQRRLSYNAEAATRRFQTLLAEVTSEYDQLLTG